MASAAELMDVAREIVHTSEHNLANYRILGSQDTISLEVAQTECDAEGQQHKVTYPVRSRLGDVALFTEATTDNEEILDLEFLIELEYTRLGL